jgi:hypothetical protein
MLSHFRYTKPKVMIKALLLLNVISQGAANEHQYPSDVQQIP